MYINLLNRLNSRTEQRKLRAEAALAWLHLQAPPPGVARVSGLGIDSTG